MEIRSNCLFLPENSIDPKDLLTKAGNNQVSDIEKIVATTGFIKLSRCNEPRASKFLQACCQLFAPELQETGENLRAVIVVTQSSDVRIPSLSARMQSWLNAPSSAVFLDIVDGCCGFVKATIIAERFLVSPSDRVLIVAGDLNSLMTKNSAASTQILFGDGFGFTLVGPSQHDFLSKIQTISDNDGFIEAEIGDQASLSMDGFQVFRFTSTIVSQMLVEANKLLFKRGYRQFAVAYHQASKFVVEQLEKKNPHKNPDWPAFNCGAIGNLGAGSIPAWISQMDTAPKQGLPLLCVGFGAGLSFGYSLLDLHLISNRVRFVDI